MPLATWAASIDKWRSTSTAYAVFETLACVAALGALAMNGKHETVVAVTVTCIATTVIASRLAPDALHILRRSKSEEKDQTPAVVRRRQTGNLFLVLPHVVSYEPRCTMSCFEGERDRPRWRLVIEHNDRVGPVTAHFENGASWGFLSACLPRHKPELANFVKKWNLFLEDYMRNGDSHTSARAGRFFSDSFYLTLCSERVLLNDMLVGEGYSPDDDDSSM